MSRLTNLTNHAWTGVLWLNGEYSLSGQGIDLLYKSKWLALLRK